MPIVHMANRLTDIPANAVNVKYHDHVAEGTSRPMPYWTYETHVGLCLFESEVNGYDDSDFYMTVWNPETKAPESILFASTRGWTYPCYASRPDATDEVKTAYTAYLRRKEDDAREHARKREARTPVSGRRVRIIAPYKSRAAKLTIPAGTTGTVFWFGADGFASRYSRYATSSDPRNNMRVGVQIDGGEKVFMPATKVEVIDEAASTA